MPVYNVKIKWGKQLIDVDCNTDEPPLQFKHQIYSLTGVLPERQKIMTKGGTLKDEEWGKVEIKNGLQMMMMGSADELPSAPAGTARGAGATSDTADQGQIADEGKLDKDTLPLGIGNLGNTCYMNATLQCLLTVPELRLGLQRYNTNRNVLSTAAQARREDSMLTEQLRDFYSGLSQGRIPYGSAFLLTALHHAYPQFGQRNEKGELSQHDAFELWTNLMGVLHDRIEPQQPSEARKEIEFHPASSSSDALPASIQQASSSLASGSLSSNDAIKFKNLIDQYFGMEFEQTTEAKEDASDTNTTMEFSTQMNCHIDQNTKYLHSCLRKWAGEGETITKKSSKLDRDAEFKVSRKFTRLPGYLTVQLVRFFYKSIQKREGPEGVSAKILKDVKFPVSLDLYDFCSDELKKRLTPQREKFRLREEQLVAKEVENVLKVERINKAKPVDTSNMLASGIAKGAKVEPFWFADDLGSNNSGYYELQAILTHQGRSSNSGHYVAWTKYRPNEWLKFDDDEVSVVSEEDVLRLSGGGDWHMAYVLLYGPRLLEHQIASTSEPAASSAVSAQVSTVKSEDGKKSSANAKMDTLD